MKIFFKIVLVFSSLFSLQLKGQQDQLISCDIASNSQRIVVAGGSVAEILYFIDADKKIVATDVTSTFPKEAQNHPSIGYVRNLSAEGILSMNPSLILGEDDMGPPKVITQLIDVEVDIRTIPEEKSVDGILDKIYCIASILDMKSEAEEEINKTLMPDIIALENMYIKNSKRLKRVMFILSMQANRIIVAGAGTTGDGYIKLTGSKNIFGNLEGWKSVSQEAIVKEDPDYIIMSQSNLHNTETIKNVKENPIFKNIKAGKEGNFIFDDAMAMLGFGPRTIRSALQSALTIYNDE